jgi:hypothetical protein
LKHSLLSFTHNVELTPEDKELLKSSHSNYTKELKEVTNTINNPVKSAQENIITFLGAMNQDSDAVQDCLYAAALNVSLLEKHFQGWLWVDSPTWVGYDEADRAYALELGRIEMEVVLNGWIYEEDAE